MLGAALLWLAAPVLPLAAQDATIAVPADDAEMAAAIRQARAGLPVFFGHANAPGPDEGGFMIKYDLLPGPAAEFIWAEVIAHRGDVTTARLRNAPRTPGFAQGQEVSVRDNQVIDWGYWRAGTLVGGATMRVLIARMPADEARATLDRLGW
ncbi:DUF2314 domain-containing protein [Sphingomonas psychrotolerans]|uniref:DUF2314 domain-containing protein n=1 Tax=Sphingomonas psychrotolerans TaxID=1327635 RepID=A0ABU3N3W1_9SPHN|nr:DUF2314 domain-containing protein [Sphingomonas psychrotolerans]MDT8759068.1 DUF2314 domain-containing protein [Sphingomonas psychrotolerans]